MAPHPGGGAQGLDCPSSLSSNSRSVSFPAGLCQLGIGLSPSFHRWAIPCRAPITAFGEQPKPFKTNTRALFASKAITDSELFGHLMRRTVTPHPLHISQQLPKKRMAAKRGRIADQQQFAPSAGHAHVHAADVRQKADLALGVAACQRDGNDVSLLALKRIDGANAGPALQQMFMQPSKTPCAPQHALPRHWQNVGQFAWMACPCHFRCVPPRFGQQVCLSLKMDLTRYVFKSIIWQ